MRKAFIEPDMKVIKLNLNENIAASPGDDYSTEEGGFGGYKMKVNSAGKVVNTEATPDDIRALINSILFGRAVMDDIFVKCNDTYPNVSECLYY